MENAEKEENKKESEVVYKEESVALKENNETPNKEKKKKKKSKKISLEKLNLGKKPINISTSNDFINFKYIYYFMKSRIRMILYIIAGIIVLIILLTLKGLFHSSNEEENDLMEEKHDNQDENEIKPVQEDNSRFPRFNLTREKKNKEKKET